MALSWHEIRTRADNFVHEWKDKNISSEIAEAQTFLNEFFYVFGLDRKKVAFFEKPINLGETETDMFGNEINKSHTKRGRIDLFLEGKIIIEMKKPGADLQAAFEQARNYAKHIKKDEDLPEGLLICDFKNFHYYDTNNDMELHQFTLEELRNNVELFSYLAGQKKIKYNPINPVNIAAAESMGRLYDAFKNNNYKEHEIEIYLVRILFCLFADASGIFREKGAFFEYIKDTKDDGSDIAQNISLLFQILNKDENERQTNLREKFKNFPYINGGLFEDKLDIASFDATMRTMLLRCCEVDWSKINPEIFGAMFQSINDKEKRRILGEHYTSETNILKVIKPLFLDNLHDEFNKIKKLTSAVRKQKLLEFHNKLQKLKFLDPACGCGNFLVVSYRELRLLEIDVLLEYLQLEKLINIDLMVRVNVDQFYGIEIEDFPARIAQTALWLMDHLMNNLASEKLGEYIARFPLTATPHIIIDNALTKNWEELVKKDELSYILGNPPFSGARIMSKEQKSEVNTIFNDMKNNCNLDYVTCWYRKAAQYIQSTEIEAAFVSTNSICQGEQVSILWPELMNRYNIKINFAHQTFKWSNEARGKAAVYCVIIGFALSDRNTKKIYQYATVTSEPMETIKKQINAYLVDAPMLFIQKRNKPICNVSEMVFGNMPNDRGYFSLNKEERKKIIKENPEVKKVIKTFMGADEFINNMPRYCIWLKDVIPTMYEKSKEIKSRIKNVRDARNASDREATRKLAEFPTLFGEIRQPDTNYLLVPRVSSERRKYIPIGFLKKDVIAGDSTMVIPNATLYEFGILTSSMHMAWVRYICGRLKSDYRYSASIVYNNYPWPSPSDKQKNAIETTAASVLDARKKYPDLSLAKIYESDTMLPELVKAHQKLDKAVEAAYGRTFDNDSERVAYLFELYQKLSGELFIDDKKRGKGRKKK